MTDERSAAQAALVSDLRMHITESIKGQWQLLQVAALVAGVIASFGWSTLQSRPNGLALLGLLFLGFALAILRLDQEIAIAASHLLDQAAFGEHALSQRSWEQFKLRSMQRSGAMALIASSTQTAAVYGVPILAAFAMFGEALSGSPGSETWVLALLGGLVLAFFAIGAIDVAGRYRALGETPSTP